MYYRILVASQRYHGDEPLTYSSSHPLSVGQLVKVPLGNIDVLGLVVTSAAKPQFPTKPVAHTWDLVVPITTNSFVKWLHAYYPAPLGSIVELFTPPALTKTTTIPAALPAPTALANSHLPELTSQQASVFRSLQKFTGKSVLLHGDTGTGKTRLYIEIARKSIEAGKSVIITTPEIGLTTPLVKLFSQVFGDRVHITHSGMPAAARRAQWIAVCSSQTPVILLGPRSALFYPVHDLGLIILDEAHDTAYKQDQAPYYQATRAAAALTKLHNAQLILGTATPLVADYFTFRDKSLPIVRLSQPAISSEATLEHVVVDARDRSHFTRSAHLSNQLLDAISGALSNKEQSLLFLNRRGSARVILCNVCGWRALCPHCDTALTFHADTHNMRCHSCDYKGSVPGICPDCGGSDLLFKSIGTKALEEEIARLFPSSVIARFDGDTHRSNNLTAKFNDLQQGNIDIIIGTQAIAKGHDLPKLSVVGIVQADMSLSIPDYTATERTYQLLSQVSGRAGRGHRNGTLIIQTHNPRSDVIDYALAKDYDKFYEQEIRERQAYNFPPFTHLMTVTCSRSSSKSAEKACQKAADQLRTNVSGIAIDGPTPRFLEKVANKYSWHLIVRAKSRTKLTEAIKHLPAGCIPNLDPTDLL